MMNTTWHTFLTAQGANLTTEGAAQFAESPANWTGTVQCALTQFGLLRVTGEDAQGFLQNLFSNDIREASPTHAQLSSFNSPKGRMLASFWIWQDEAGYVLQLPRSLAEMMRKKLSMYVLRSKVKVTDISNEFVMIGVSGDLAMLPEACPTLPEGNGGVAHSATVSVLRLSDTRCQLITTAEHAPALWQSLQRTPASSACWDWLTIQAGVPVILPATQEQFVPQMVNFAELGGVNFKKGCYPGQEIVARMQYLGKLKRRMYRAHLDGAAQPGDELFSADMEGQPSGMIVNVAPAPQGGYDVLAVLQISSRETETIRCKSLQGEALTALCN